MCGVRARAECFGDIGLTKLRPALSNVLGVAIGRLVGRIVSSALGLGKSGISRRTSAGGANKAGATWLGRRREPGITGSSWLKRKCAGASRSLRACFIPCLPYQSYIRSAWFTRNVCFTSSSILSSSAKLVSWQQQNQESSKPTHCYDCIHDHSILPYLNVKLDVFFYPSHRGLLTTCSHLKSCRSLFTWRSISCRQASRASTEGPSSNPVLVTGSGRLS